MTKPVLVAPSTDPCYLDKLVKYEKLLLNSGADWIHCDVMDGVFVERKNFDYTNLMQMSKKAKAYFDVHLMVAEPNRVVDNFILSGASSISVHIETFQNESDVLRIINFIHSANCKVGLALNPDTDIRAVVPYLDKIDLVLVMSVVPGKSGQSFIPSSLEKISKLNDLRKKQGLHFLIEVDGGLNEDNAKDVILAGADALVFGSAMFKATDKAKFISTIKSL